MEETESHKPELREYYDFKNASKSEEVFAYTFLKYDTLCYKSSVRDQSAAYTQMSKALNVPVAKVIQWTNKFRLDFYHRMFKVAMAPSPPEKLALEPAWVRDVENKLRVLPGAILQASFRRAKGSAGHTTDDLLRLLVAFSKRHRSLCASALYVDLKRTLRIGSSSLELHSLWVHAQSVSLQLVRSHIRRGDIPSKDLPVSDTNWQIADLVVLFTDVKDQRLVTEDSLVMPEECFTLMRLLMLVHKHGVEAASTKAESASRWTKVYDEYIQDGKQTTIVILQRRWHEFKLQARMRFCDFRNNVPDSKTPHFVHIELIRKEPTVLTSPLANWAWQVAYGKIILEPVNAAECVKEGVVNYADDDDVLLIEKPVEVIAVDSDDETKHTADASLPKEPNTKSSDNTLDNKEQVNTKPNESKICPDNKEYSITINNSDKHISVDVAHTSSILPQELRPPDSIEKSQHDIGPVGNVKMESEPALVEKLESLDPNKLKVQIIFESDSDEDTKPNIGVTNTEPSESTPVPTSPNNGILKQLLEMNMEQRHLDDDRDKENKVCDAVDTKFLMNNRVELVRLHDTPFWQKYSYKGKYIKISKINILELHTKNDRARYVADLTEERTREAMVDDILDKNRSDNGKRKRTNEPRISKANRITKNSKRYDRSFASDSSTDEEMPLSAIYRPLQRAAAWKRKSGDASDLPDNATKDLDSSRKAKKVKLHDIEEVRRTNQSLLTAEVAPISAKRVRCKASDDDSDYDDDVRLAAPKSNDLDKNRLTKKDLKKLLDQLPTMASREWSHSVSATEYCCLARRHFLINDTRRRISPELPPVNLHVHGESGVVCNCCCLYLLDETAINQKLTLDLNFLTEGLRKMLEIPQRQRTALLQKSDEPPPIKPPKGKPKAAKRKTASASKPRSKKAKETPLPTEKAVIHFDINEWEKVKKLNDPYFKLNNKTNKTQEVDMKVQPSVSEKSKDTSAPNEKTVPQVTNSDHVSPKNCGYVVFEYRHANAADNKDKTTKVAPNEKCAPTHFVNELTDLGLVRKKIVESLQTLPQCIPDDRKPTDGYVNFIQLRPTFAQSHQNTPQDTVKDCNVNLNAGPQRKPASNETNKLVNLLFVNGKMVSAIKTLSEKSDKEPAASNKNIAEPVTDDHTESHTDVKDDDNPGPYLYRSQAPRITLERLTALCAPSLPVILRADAARPVLKLPGGYIIITETSLPCISPTYWTLAPYRNVARVFMDNNKNINSMLKFVGKEVVEINELGLKQVSVDTVKLPNNPCNDVLVKKDDSDGTDKNNVTENNDVIHVLDSDSNDEETSKYFRTTDNTSHNDLSESHSEEQQDFTNLIKITDVVGGVSDFTKAGNKAKSDLKVHNVKSKSDVTNENPQTAVSPPTAGIISNSPELINISSNAELANQTVNSDSKDSLSTALATEDVNHSSVKETEIIKGNEHAEATQNVIPNADSEAVNVNNKLGESDEKVVCQNELNSSLGDSDEDMDRKLVIDERCSDSSMHNRSDDSHIKSADESNNDVRHTENAETNEDKKDIATDINIIKNENNSGLKDLSAEAEKVSKEHEIAKENKEKIACDRDIKNENNSDLKELNAKEEKVSKEHDISTGSKEKAACESTSADDSSEPTKDSTTDVERSLKIFNALSVDDNLQELIATSKDLYLMRRYTGSITPMLRVERNGVEGIASTVNKQTLVAVGRLLNGNVDAISETQESTACPVIDITED